MAVLQFKALSDETRIRLVHILQHYELSVNELVHILGMGQSRVSRHLKILAEAGLVASRRDGLWAFYSCPREGQACELLKAMLPFAELDASHAADLEKAAQALEERTRKTRQFFNDIAEDWDELNREVLGSFDLAEAVDAALPAGCTCAADLGCGTGAVLARLLPRVAQGVIGVDGSARMLDLCRHRFAAEDIDSGRVSLRIGDLSHLPMRDEEVDFACINLVLHHLSNPGSVLAEISRVMRRGGMLFVADFLRHDDEAMRSRYGDRWLGFEEDELGGYIGAAGFSIVSKCRQPVGRGLELVLFRACTSLA